MTTTPKLDLRLTISVNDTANYGDYYLHFEAHVAFITERGEVDYPREYGSEAGLSGLGIHGQQDPGAWSRGSDFYGCEVAYLNAHRPRLHDVERMVKQLRKVHARLTKLDERYGHAVTGADHVVRLADAIGTTQRYCFGRRVPDSMDGTGFRWMDADGLRSYLAEQQTTWAQRRGLVREVAA